MYLTKKKFLFNDERKKLKVSGVKGINSKKVNYILEEAGYWRKANAIHGWFVDNIQEEVDDCREYLVIREDMRKLLNIVEKVLKSSKLVKGKVQNGTLFKDGKDKPIMEDGEFIKDPTMAKLLLPVRPGFFFGNYNEETAYDKWYCDDLKLTKKILKEALADKEGEYYYQSSW